VSDEVFECPEMLEFLKGTPAVPELSEFRFRGFSMPRRVWRIPLTLPALAAEAEARPAYSP
jgi:hypothetical protein